MEKREELKMFFEFTLRGILSGEKALAKSLNALGKKASSEELQQLLRRHYTETINQEERLEEIFHSLGTAASKSRIEEAEGVLNKGKEALKSLATLSLKSGASSPAEGVLEKAETILEHVGQPELLDYVIASSNQLIEYAEILAYTSAIEMAEVLECPSSVLELLQASLEEEKRALEDFTQLTQNKSPSFVETWQ